MTTIRLLIAGCSLFLLTACGDKPAAPTPAPSPSPATPGATAAAPITPEVLAKLAQADAKDGTVDKVVHRCAGCALGMDGKAEMSLKVQDYTMHFCKPKCVDKFAPDPATAILALKIKE
jgi:hypothetical protein